MPKIEFSDSLWGGYPETHRTPFSFMVMSHKQGMGVTMKVSPEALSRKEI